VTQRQQHMPEALGNEWFRTNPDELREIVKDMASRMTRKESKDES